MITNNDNMTLMHDGKLVSDDGALTLAVVDLPNDKWCWSIVSDFKGPQEYGEIYAVLGSTDDFWAPNDHYFRAILNALAKERKTIR